MEYKDYYRILGVSWKANKGEIKRAYRKLALQYHPDRNSGDKQAEDKLKEINESYQVLSDERRRARYDQIYDSYSRYQKRGGTPGNFNWEEWFTPQGTESTGSKSQTEAGNLGEILSSGFSEFFSRIFGGLAHKTAAASPGESRHHRAAQTKNHQPLEITLQEAYLGTTNRFEINGQRIEVKIPRGAHSGTKVRIPESLPAGPDGHKDDLYLDIRVLDDARFERKDNDLFTEIPIDLYSAVLGGEVTVPTLDGTVLLKVPPGTQPGRTFRLAEKGMPDMKSPHIYGDLYVRAKVNVPRNLTRQQRELFEQLARISK